MTIKMIHKCDFLEDRKTKKKIKKERRKEKRRGRREKWLI
jgi:hypothetical protein